MERSGQSGLGIASLASSIVSIIIAFIVILIAGVMEVNTPGGIDDAPAVVVGFFVFACLGLNLVSIGLGLAGIIQRQRTRVCAVIGTILASASSVVLLSLIVIGSAVDS